MNAYSGAYGNSTGNLQSQIVSNQTNACRDNSKIDQIAEGLNATISRFSDLRDRFCAVADRAVGSEPTASAGKTAGPSPVPNGRASQLEGCLQHFAALHAEFTRELERLERFV